MARKRKRLKQTLTVRVLEATGSPLSLARLLRRLFGATEPADPPRLISGVVEWDPPELGDAPWDKVISPSPAPSAEPTEPEHEALTPAQRRVAALLAESRTNGEIARALTVELNTVKSHVSAIYRKLGVRNRGQFLEWWARHNEKRQSD